MFIIFLVPSTAVRVILQRPSEPVLSQNMHCIASFFRHMHYSSHYAWVDFKIVHNVATLTSSAAFDVIDELQSTRWVDQNCYVLSTGLQLVVLEVLASWVA